MTLEELAKAVVEGDDVRARVLSEQLLGNGVSSSDLIEQGLAAGMRILGEKWGRGEVFLADVMIAVTAFEEAMKAIRPHIRIEETAMSGTVVLGTVEGDIHYIGKDIVASVLECAGFKVINIGEDVTTRTFCNTVLTAKPEILGMSCLISSSLPKMKEVIEELEKRDLRKDVIVMVGGAPVTMEYAREIGADICASDAFKALTMAKEAMRR